MLSLSVLALAASIVTTTILRISTSQSIDDDLSMSDLDTDEVLEVMGDIGSTVRLPCMHSNNVSKSSIRLILWYRHNSGAPFYSYDTRGRALLDGAHWSEDSELGRRSELDPRPSSPELLITRVIFRDGGLYRCRADLRNQPTFNSLVRLVVSVPAEFPQLVVQRTGKVLTVAGQTTPLLIGPYREGESVQVTCRTRGGVPQPNVTWWMQGTLLDSSWQRRGHVTANTLTLSNVSRGLLYDEFTCLVANSNQTPPQAISFQLDLYLAPRSVSLYRRAGSPVNMLAGGRYEFNCEVIGARPSPQIRWTKDKTYLNNSTEVHHNTSAVVSTLSLEVEWTDHGSTITCRAGSSSTSYLQRSLQLDVHYAPVVNITLGKSLQLDRIFEGRDVYFECGIEANPAAKNVQWYQDGVLLHGDKSAGVIVSGGSLALQSVNIHSCSHYSCSAANQIAEIFSSEIYLDVKYTPRCVAGQKSVHGTSLLDQVRIYCSVEANPAEALVFSWSFNNTGESVSIGASQYTLVNETSSRLNYLPKTRLDYGTISCSAANSVGRQQSPCLFHVVPMEAPDPPAFCTEVNRSITWVQLHCKQEPSDVPLSYRLKVVSLTGKQVASWQQTTPHFLIENLAPAHSYTVLIYAETSGGRSDPAELRVITPPDPSHQRTGLVIAGSSRGGEQFYKWSYTWTVVVASCVALFCLCGATLAVWMRRTGSARQSHSPAGTRSFPDADADNKQLTVSGNRRQPQTSVEADVVAGISDFICPHNIPKIYLQMSESESMKRCVSCERFENNSSCPIRPSTFGTAELSFKCTQLPDRSHFFDQLISRNREATTSRITETDGDGYRPVGAPLEFQDTSIEDFARFHCN